VEIALLLSGLLILASRNALSLPGCGDASPCDQASKSVWGRVPFIDVSVAVVGASYFLAMGLAWMMTRGRFGLVLKTTAAIGAAISLLYVGVMLAEKLLCMYCLGSHVMNFVFCACVFIAQRKNASQKSAPRLAPAFGAGAALAAFLLTFAVLFASESSNKGKVLAQQEKNLQASIDAMKSTQTQTTPTQDTPQPTQPTTQQASPSDAQAVTPATQTQSTAASTALTGRSVWGASEAGIRIVMFTDYQCPDCKLLEAQLTRLQQTAGIKDNLSVAIRHFPVSTLCNSTIQENRHPDACYAAYASEAAAQLGGTSAFWTMHNWLFSKNGSFTREALTAQVQAMGLDTRAFFSAMESDLTKSLIQEDIALAQRMGIAFTPMIFVNGVELRGYTAPDALVRTVTALAATQPAKAQLGSDVALTARERALDEFAKSPIRVLPSRFTRREIGPKESDISVVVVGDYQEPGTREADNLLRIFTRGPGETIRYSFVHFPVNQACNPHVPFTKYNKSCMAAQMVEGAELIAGADSFWRVHDWLMQQGVVDSLSKETAELAAPTFVDTASGAAPITIDLLTDAMKQQYVSDQIAADAKAALDFGVTSLPAIFINGKLVGTWKVEKENLLPAMFTAIREGKK
jgi:protein-disulfide isomerase/uncharacterized membrane protein